MSDDFERDDLCTSDLAAWIENEIIDSTGVVGVRGGRYRWAEFSVSEWLTIARALRMTATGKAAPNGRDRNITLH